MLVLQCDCMTNIQLYNYKCNLKQRKLTMPQYNLRISECLKNKLSNMTRREATILAWFIRTQIELFFTNINQIKQDYENSIRREQAVRT